MVQLSSVICSNQKNLDDCFLALPKPSQKLGTISANSKWERAYTTAPAELIIASKLKLASIQLVNADPALAQPCLLQSTWMGHQAAQGFVPEQGI